VISPTNLAFFFSRMNTMLRETYNSTPVRYQDFCSTIPSDTEQNVYGWMGRLDQMRLWAGPRVTAEPAPQTYTLINQPFEQTRKIDRFKLDDDQLGIFYATMPDMALQAKRWPDFQVRDLLQNRRAQTGTRQLGLDGLSGFNTAHPIDLYDSSKGTYSNDFTGGGQTINGVLVGGAFSQTAIATLYEYMMTLKAEDNETVGVTPNVLLVPPALKLEAELFIKSTFLAPPSWGTATGQVGAADNPLRRFGLDPIVWEVLNTGFTGGNTYWYMLDTTKAFKPFVWQLRQAPVLAVRTNEQDPVVFDDHTYLYGYWARGAPGWNYSFLFARSGP
jgi:phage major head subunit gpT-like protein